MNQETNYELEDNLERLKSSAKGALLAHKQNPAAQTAIDSVEKATSVANVFNALHKSNLFHKKEIMQIMKKLDTTRPISVADSLEENEIRRMQQLAGLLKENEEEVERDLSDL